MLFVQVSPTISSWYPSTYRTSSISSLCLNSQLCVKGWWAPVESTRKHLSNEIWVCFPRNTSNYKFFNNKMPVLAAWPQFLKIGLGYDTVLCFLVGLQGRKSIMSSALISTSSMPAYLCVNIASGALLDMIKWEKCGFSDSLLCVSHPIRMFSS